MRFGQTKVLKNAKGKIGVGLALIFFGAVSVLAAPTAADKALCASIVLAGAVFIWLGVRQDRSEKDAIRNSDKEAKQ